jgi:hypothetical protein
MFGDLLPQIRLIDHTRDRPRSVEQQLDYLQSARRRQRF